MFNKFWTYRSLSWMYFVSASSSLFFVFIIIFTIQTKDSLQITQEIKGVDTISLRNIYISDINFINSRLSSIFSLGQGVKSGRGANIYFVHYEENKYRESIYSTIAQDGDGFIRYFGKNNKLLSGTLRSGKDLFILESGKNNLDETWLKLDGEDQSKIVTVDFLDPFLKISSVVIQTEAKSRYNRLVEGGSAVCEQYWFEDITEFLEFSGVSRILLDICVFEEFENNLALAELEIEYLNSKGEINSSVFEVVILERAPDFKINIPDIE